MDAEDERNRRHKKEKHRENEGKRSKRGRSRSPGVDNDRNSRRKRKHSKSASPVSSERDTKKDKPNEAQNEPQVKAEPPERKRKETDMLNTRTGGAYIPPARLRMMQAQITDKSSVAFQRLAWEALKKSIHGHINKINIGNIGIIIKELLKENIVRGRGLLCRSIIQAQAASPTFTNVYAALVSAVNSRFPNIGELLLKRLVIQFKRGFKRNDKPICISAASFIAHLVNQRVAHEILALELLTLLVESPTDDSVEVAIAFLKECGQKLTEVSSKGVNAIFEMLRNILHEGQLDKRVQYMIEVMFQVWKDGFKDHPALIEELELVPEEEQFTHLMMLDEATDGQDILNVFKHDEKYEENEEKYKKLCKEILGSDAESGDEEGSGSEGDSEDEEDDEDTEKPVTIIDNTETNLVALRRTIYLTINSSLDFEECAHKLMKMQLKPGQEIELCHMFLDCCAEQRTYEKFYGLLAQRFCNINRVYIDPFEEIFKESYSTAHRLDMNRLRNVSKFFAHLLFTDSISWEVLECVKLNEEDTTSSSRIYIKILFQELAEYLGMKKLNDRLKDQTLQGAFSGLFPRDNPKNTRFSINFFTSIGLGGLTDELREHLKQLPKNIPPPETEIKVASSSSESSSSSSDSSSSDSSSSDGEDDEDDAEKNKKKQKKKSKENKDKTPKTPEPEKNDNDRWGHNGFFETYGQDARRHEPRNDEAHEFVRPRDVRSTDNRRRNGEDDRSKRNDDGDRNRRNDRRYERSDESNSDRSDRDNERRGRDDSRRERDDGKRNRGDGSRSRDDGSGRLDEDKRRLDESKNSRDNDKRNRDDGSRNHDDNKRSCDDGSRSRDDGSRSRDDGSRSRDDGSRRLDENKKSRDDDKSRHDDGSRRKDRDSENDRRDRDSNKRTIDGAKNDRRDHDNDRKDRDNNRREHEEKKSDRDEHKKSREIDRNDDRRGRDGKDRNHDRNEKRARNLDRNEKRDRDHDRNEKRDRDHDRNEKKDRDKTRDRNEEREKRKEKESHRKSTKTIKEESESESETDSSSSSSESEEERHKRDKQKDKNDGWDIRGSSIRRESPPRYWAISK